MHPRLVHDAGLQHRLAETRHAWQPDVAKGWAGDANQRPPARGGHEQLLHLVQLVGASDEVCRRSRQRQRVVHGDGPLEQDWHARRVSAVGKQARWRAVGVARQIGALGVDEVKLGHPHGAIPARRREDALAPRRKGLGDRAAGRAAAPVALGKELRRQVGAERGPADHVFDDAGLGLDERPARRLRLAAVEHHLGHVAQQADERLLIDDLDAAVLHPRKGILAAQPRVVVAAQMSAALVDERGGRLLDRRVAHELAADELLDREALGVGLRQAVGAREDGGLGGGGSRSAGAGGCMGSTRASRAAAAAAAEARVEEGRELAEHSLGVVGEAAYVAVLVTDSSGAVHVVIEPLERVERRYASGQFRLKLLANSIDRRERKLEPDRVDLVLDECDQVLAEVVHRDGSRDDERVGALVDEALQEISGILRASHEAPWVGGTLRIRAIHDGRRCCYRGRSATL